MVLCPVFLGPKLHTMVEVSRLWDLREVTHHPGPLIECEAFPVDLTSEQKREVQRAFARMSDGGPAKRHRRT